MDLFIFKIIQRCMTPLSICLFGTILTGLVVYWKRKVAIGLMILCMGILWFASMPAMSWYVWRAMEGEFPPVPVAQAPEADAIVVLGGCIGIKEPPRVEVDLVNTSDRVLHAFRLYCAGKAPIIIATGGVKPWLGTKTPESDGIYALLEEWGVPPSAIVREQGSLNTYENAIHTQKLMERLGLKKVLLVTSALHMKRALATFRGAGIDAIPSPTDYGALNSKKFTVLDFLPDSESLAGITQAYKEYLGFLVYRWRGWIT